MLLTSSCVLWFRTHWVNETFFFSLFSVSDRSVALGPPCRSQDKMKPALNKWLDQLSEQLLNSTRIVNNLDQKLDESEGK